MFFLGFSRGGLGSNSSKLKFHAEIQKNQSKASGGAGLETECFGETECFKETERFKETI